MSCLYSVWLHIYTFILEAPKIVLLQHPVLKEYAKIVVSSDFSHTFPTFIFISAIYIVLRKKLNVNWIQTLVIVEYFSRIIKIVVIWNIMHIALWGWLIMQRSLYCAIWTNWRSESGFPEFHYPWWKRVFASFDPPPREPLLSAGFISWTLSMMISVACIYFAIHMDHIVAMIQKFFKAIKRNLKNTRKWQKSLLNLNHSQSQDILTNEVEVEPNCNYCKLDTSISCEVPNIVRRKIFPISNGTNWILPPNNNLKNLKNVERSTV